MNKIMINIVARDEGILNSLLIKKEHVEILNYICIYASSEFYANGIDIFETIEQELNKKGINYEILETMELEI